MKRNVYLAFLFFLFAWGPLYAQQGKRELPLSFQPAFQERLSTRQVSTSRIFQPDLRRLREEDAINPGTRFAAPVKADFDLNNSGTWAELPNGDRLWRLQLRAEDALGLIALYDELFIPQGAHFFMYSIDRQSVFGPFTFKDNKPNGKFVTGPAKGETAVLEYFEPVSVRGQGRLHIFRVDYGYHRENIQRSGFDVYGALENELGFGTSDTCQTNMNCSAGADYSREKRAVSRILLVVQEGTGYCTGSLVNNTKNDGRPLLITAFHCQDGYVPLYDFWRFDFNYESPSCLNPASEPSYNSLVGCIARSGRRENDFLLLELNQEVPPSFNAYFLGWNRSIAAPSRGGIIHHPRGDIRKISIDNDGVSIFRDSIVWNNNVTTPPEHHFRSRFDLGSYDIGSSGAPLLNQDRHFVGQLHGGAVSCSGSTAYFGRLFKSWEGGESTLTRLKDWLDPEGTGQMILEGIENPSNSGGEISGIVHLENGTGIPGAKVSLITQSGLALSTITDSIGGYLLSGIPYGEALEVTVTKADLAVNGCSVADLIKVQKHILSLDQLITPFQWIAADVNASRSISTLDLIQIRKVILGVDEEFKNVPAWIFILSETTFPNAPNPFLGASGLMSAFQLNSFSQNIPDLDFLGIKHGDVNHSVNLKN